LIIDKLYEEVEKKGIVCLGLDTHMDYIPNWVKEKYKDTDEIIFQFNRMIIDNTLDIVPIYKLQIAYYEAYGIKGLLAYKRTLEYIKEKGSLSIGDIKRGDISATAKMYARAHFKGDFETDFITLNPYMGFDSITPYLDYIKDGEKGIFVLLRTSNPGAKDIQYLNIDGKEGSHLYYSIGDRLNEMAKDYLGTSGYSHLGIVTGGTHREEAMEIRDRYKNQFFLIPGYGHQGGKAEDVDLYLNNKNGGIVNSSRGIILAYKNYEDGEENFYKYAREAAIKMRDDILGVK
jgi:orotidine-5'-phosphate decarboxylase